MRMRHNKKRNTAFLYECLVRELTVTVLRKNQSRKRKALSLIKEYFIDDCPLKKEMTYFNMILNEASLDAPTAERFLWEVKTEHQKNVCKKEIFRSQSSLIKRINTILGKDVYSSFVPNYKKLATINAIFNLDLTPKDKVLLEGNTIKSMMSDQEPTPISQDKEPIDNLVYHSFVKRFNDMYGDSLLQEQKDLVSRYIVSFHDNNVGLKIYLNEEITRLNCIIKDSKNSAGIRGDSEMLGKIERVLSILESFQEKTIDTGLVEDVLKIQQLANEIEAND